MYVRTKREWTKENTDNSLVAGRNLAGGGRGNGNRTSWFPGWVTGGEAARAISLLEADVLVQSMNHTGLKKTKNLQNPKAWALPFAGHVTLGMPMNLLSLGVQTCKVGNGGCKGSKAVRLCTCLSKWEMLQKYP